MMRLKLRDYANTMVLELTEARPAVDEPSACETESDQSLIHRAKSDPDAFGLLYERYVTAIYRYAYYRIGDIQDAEDVTARVFARALKHIRNYNERGVPFAAWLYRIAHNVVVNFHRDAARRPSVSLDEADDEGGPLGELRADDDSREHDHAIDLQADQLRLASAIRKLPEERQQLIVLKFVEQLPNSEIGQIMSRSEGAVKSLYHRTLTQLRELLQTY